MLFAVSKLLEYVILPSNLIGLLGLAGLLLMLIRRWRLGRSLLILAVLLLLVVGWSPIGRFGLVVLENRFPPPTLSGSIAGIIVLGGSIDTHISYDRNTVAVTDAGERLTGAAELARRFADARIVLSGGASRLISDKSTTESSLSRDLLIGIGMPASRIELEERSLNTCENAVESKLVAAPKAGEQWILVTSASHMPRAVACFRTAGFPVVPYPVDYRTLRDDSWRPSSSIADGLDDADLAEHEWLGLVGYHFVRGTELFPAP